MHSDGCLFCRRHDGGFTSEEHVVPIALGNVEDVLPPGVVCDRCNNGPLARTERALVGFQPIAFLRTIAGIKSRRGTVPASQWGNALVENHGVLPNNETNLSIDAHTDGVFQPTGENSFRLHLRSGGPMRSSTYAQITRCLWKMGLEYLYIDYGDRAFGRTYDEVREMVMGARRPAGWIALQEHSEPHANVHLAYQPDRVDRYGRPVIPVTFDFLGMRFATEMLVRDSGPLDHIDVPGVTVHRF